VHSAEEWLPVTEAAAACRTLAEILAAEGKWEVASLEAEAARIANECGANYSHDPAEAMRTLRGSVVRYVDPPEPVGLERSGKGSAGSESEADYSRSPAGGSPIAAAAARARIRYTRNRSNGTLRMVSHCR
jgi:hypothetical protein